MTASAVIALDMLHAWNSVSLLKVVVDSGMVVLFLDGGDSITLAVISPASIIATETIGVPRSIKMSRTDFSSVD
jgi:hypothetical protein